MRQLLDASSQRMVKIIDILFISKNWITFADLSFKIDASSRTIAEDVSLLKKGWGKDLNIHVSKKKGVRLENKSIASISLVFNDIFRSSIPLKWIKEILFHPNNKIEFYEEKLFTSRSTLNRLLPKINKALLDKELSIQCKNNCYEFIGNNEQLLRDFSASFLLELYGLNLKDFNLYIDLSIINSLVLSSLKRSLKKREFEWISDGDISLPYHMMVYIVSLIRENQNYIINSNYPVENEVSIQQLKYLQSFFPNVKMDSLRPIHEFIYKQYNAWDSDNEKNKVMEESMSFFNRIFSVIPLLPDEDTLNMLYFVTKSIYLNTKFHPNKDSTFFNRIYYFSNSLKNENQDLYNTVDENVKIFAKNLNIDMTFKTPYILFWICMICPEICFFKHSKTALLLDDLGKLHGKFLAKILSDFFNKNSYKLVKINIAKYPYISSSLALSEYDILITTIPNPPIFHRNTILINDYPSCDDFYKIHQAIFNNEA